jgi:hypothetical protein
LKIPHKIVLLSGLALTAATPPATWVGVAVAQGVSQESDRDRLRDASPEGREERRRTRMWLYAGGAALAVGVAGVLFRRRMR